jgi:hypothetical protein
MRLSFNLIAFLCLLASYAIYAIWNHLRSKKSEQWPVTDGTIQSVNTEIIREGRGSTELPVCDFSYCVDGEYYSGRLSISRTSAPDDYSPRNLINQKIHLRYDPKKPAKCFVPPVDLDGFHPARNYPSPFESDVEPTSLGLD